MRTARRRRLRTANTRRLTRAHTTLFYEKLNCLALSLKAVSCLRELRPSEIGIGSIAKDGPKLQAEISTIFNQQIIQLFLKNQRVRQIMAPRQFMVSPGAAKIELAQDLQILRVQRALEWAEAIPGMYSLGQ